MKLSIITVNLNNREGLRKTAESVVTQTYKDYEWIVIDGGSTDGCKELIEQYADHISYWVSEPDKGIYNAMNKGIRKAMGEYILFLNSGDCFVEEKVLAKVFDMSFSEDVVYGYVKHDYGDNCRIGSSPNDLTLRTFVEGTIDHTGNSFIRKDAFEKWGLYDENLKIVSDWKWFLQSIGMGTATTKYINIMVSVFDRNGISNNQRELRDYEREGVLSELLTPRIIQDYKNFAELEQKIEGQKKQIRSSYPYRIGYTILLPIKKIKQLFRIRK